MITSFQPGEHFDLSVPARDSSPVARACSVLFPLRVHISPIDCNRFDFGRAGGGGAGFAIEAPCTMSITLRTDSTVHGRGSKAALLTHFAKLFSALAGWSGGLDITLELPEYVSDHSGLGSNAAVATACLYGLNVLFGDSFAPDELRRLVATNFVEVTESGLERGLETGVGPYVVLHGGLVLMGDCATLAFTSAALNGTPVLLAFPRVGRPETDRPESLEMLERSRLLDASYCYTRAYRFLMDFVPAVGAGDLRAAGRVVWDFQFSGTHQSMIQAYDDGGLLILEALTALSRDGAEMVGMSSVGPTLYALGRQADKLGKRLDSLGIPYATTQVAARGAVASLEA